MAFHTTWGNASPRMASARWRGLPASHGKRLMSDTKSLSERIDVLETRLAYQDETIETLNKTITAQWQQIDALSRQLAALGERLSEAEANAPGPANEPPPHY
jgi:SlyX protein